MRMYLCVTVAGVLFAGRTLAEDTTKRDLDKVQGHWRVVAAEQDGKRIPKKEIEKPIETAAPDPSGRTFSPPWYRNRIFIKGERITIGDPDGNNMIMWIKLKPTEKENAVDLLIGGKEAFKGVYRLKEGELTICCAKADKSRPTEVATTKKGSGWTLLILKRVEH